jgi:amino acid adenylation domain-containing protein
MWSTEVLTGELTALYNAFLRGKATPLPDLPIQYAEFAHWQRNRMQGQVLEDQLAYWRDRLAGRLPVLDLPTRGPRPARHTFNGAEKTWRLGSETILKLKRLSQREGATLFMMLLAAFKTLLYRYTAQTDLLVGVPIANRNRAEVEGLIGLFVNTIVLRTDLSDDPTFLQLLARVREAALGAYANQDLPFEKLVEELQPERDLSRTPIFQVMFVMQNNPMPVLKMEDVTIEPMVIEGATSKFDLTLSIMEEADGGLSGWMEYNSNLFDRPMIDEMIGHYHTLLKGIMADPAEKVSRLPILTEDERRRLLYGFNETAIDYDLDWGVHQLFQAQAARTPDAIAVAFEEQEVTYRGLNHKASQLARYLNGIGVGANTLVGISMERSVEMIVAILGVLKAGGAYVPLDPTYPQDRLAFMAEDTEARILLTQSHIVAGLTNLRLTPICLDTEWDVIVAANEHAPAEIEDRGQNISAERPAYVIYTSGSTGQPKGVIAPHRAVTNMILWMQTAYQMTPQDRLLQKTSFSFDASAWEFFWPLVVGAKLVVARPYAEKDGAYLVESLKERQITFLQLVPSLLKLLVEQEGLDGCASLSHVFCGGEALPGRVCERFFERLPDTKLTNVYGPTETTMHVTVYECSKEMGEGIAPIGRPVGNTEIYIADGHLQPVPIGVAGEALIGGSQVANGYLNRASLTATRFIPDPHGKSEGRVLYRTGDLARYRPDGNIEFLGRIDHQVKLRGYRIEIGEIESVLRQHASVSEAVVITREDTPGDKCLVAYVVAKADQSIKVGGLRGHLSEKLPEYMLPSAFVLLDRLPLMTNGKVNRQALPPPDYSIRQLDQEYVAPRNEVEATVAGIFAEVLGVDQVGAEDNFFSLGGHSLLAMQVLLLILEKLEVELPVQTLFERPTVGAVSRFIASDGSGWAESPGPITRVNRLVEEELLERLDRLADEEVDELLRDVAGEERGGK